MAFARRMERFGTATETAANKGTFEAALRAKEIWVASIARAAPSMTLSGVGKSGAKVGVTFNVKGTKNPTALVRATGPLHLLENDTSEHTIFARQVGRVQGRRTRENRRAAKQQLYDTLFGGQTAGFLGNAGREFAASGVVHHPGSRGKHPWSSAMPVVRAATPQVFVRAERGQMIRIFGGR